MGDAGEDQRDKGRAKLAAFRRAESVIALGIPRCEACHLVKKEPSDEECQSDTPQDEEGVNRDIWGTSW